MALIELLVEIFQDPIIQIITVLGAFGIGIFQGIILGRAILVRFPRLQNHVKTVSIGTKNQRRQENKIYNFD